ncbi:phosphosulfolactate synthase [Bacillus sp. FJAT-18019]|uniref:Phosphosulfolactate synthase n=1 Tax=Paenibacillus solani TaxID=1705565 RepID=A0A0M1P9N0_9BACL|nr:phosphosulfolactate synthase [Bacillus sp. FJAT-18019]KOR90734.1 phosphosulfolactate synthase [Paenibacillus solani]
MRENPEHGKKNYETFGVMERGMTMVIDKGLGRNMFSDVIETASDYIDCLKFGFGTAPLYQTEILLYKINLAKQYGITVMPGGTLLETAVQQDVVSSFFNTISRLGFNSIEVSDGTIEMSRKKRTELIREGKQRGLRVFTEFGKKQSGSFIDAEKLAYTMDADLEAGAEFITVEARESGIGVGIFDKDGECREEMIDNIIQTVPDARKLLWEAPLKQQQAMLLRKFGSNVHLGNIQPTEVLALETMRRGLRQDTFELGVKEPSADDFCYII